MQRATASARRRGTHRSISAQEHDTPSFAAWHKVLEGFGSDLLSAYPPECKVIDEFFIKSRSTETGEDAVLAGLVFETSGLKAVKKFFDNGKSPIFEQGRKDGWLTGKWRENYFASAAASESRHHDTSAPSQVLRLPGADAGPAAAVPEGLGHQRARGVRPTPSTPPTRRRAGFGAHGLGVSYQDWLQAFGSPDIDAFHESMNIQYSVRTRRATKLHAIDAFRTGLRPCQRQGQYRSRWRCRRAPRAQELQRYGSL